MKQEDLGIKSDLPRGWAVSVLEDLIIYVLGGDWGKEYTGELPDQFSIVKVIRGTEFKDWYRNKGNSGAIRILKNSSLTKRQLLKGDIVLEISGGGPNQSVGRTVLIDKESLERSQYPLVCSNFFRQIRCHHNSDSRYISYYLNHCTQLGKFDEFQTQTTNLRNLNFSSFINNTIIPLPPLNEQRRIVAKLEKIIAKINTCQQRLERIPTILKRFRQSVLAAACSGRLTADWREQHPDVEPAEELLKRIHKERKRLYEEDCAKAKAEGRRKPKKPSNLNPKIHNREIDIKIPDTWIWTSFEDISSIKQYSMTSGPFGSALGTKDYVKDGIPVIRGQNVQKGLFVFENFVYVSEEKSLKLERSIAIPQDIVIVAVGAGVGNSAIVPNELPKAILSQNCNKFTLDKLFVLPKFVIFSLQISISKAQMDLVVTDTARQFLSLTNLKKMLFAIPPISEQKEIVRRVETLFNNCDAIEQRYQKAKAYTDKLTQSILAKAFRGELVPQDPNDEPAEILLEKIRSEKAQQEKQTKAKKKTKRKTTTTKKQSKTKPRQLEIPDMN